MEINPVTDDSLKNFTPGSPNQAVMVQSPVTAALGLPPCAPPSALSASSSFSVAPEVLSAKMDESNNNLKGHKDLFQLKPKTNAEDKDALTKAYNECKSAALEKFGKSAHGKVSYDELVASLFLDGEEVVSYLSFDMASELWVDLKSMDVESLSGFPVQTFLGGRCYITNRRMVIMTTDPCASIKEDLVHDFVGEGDEKKDAGYTKQFEATVSDSVEFYSIPLPSFLPGYRFEANHNSLARSQISRPPEEEMALWRIICCCYRKSRFCCGKKNEKKPDSCCCLCADEDNDNCFCCRCNCNFPDDPYFQDAGEAYHEVENSRDLQLPYYAPPWGKQAILKVTVSNNDDETGQEITNRQIAEFMSKFQTEAVKQGAPLNKAVTAIGTMVRD